MDITDDIDTNSREKIERFLIEYGFRPGLAGFEMIARILAYCVEDPYKGMSGAYKKVAAELGSSYGTVVRCINYAVTSTQGLTARIFAETGIKLNSHDLHGSLVIAYLSRLYKVADHAQNRLN